jgi:hypothetical protein
MILSWNNNKQFVYYCQSDPKRKTDGVKSLQAVEEVLCFHHELVLGFHNVLNLLDAEIHSTGSGS